jgi:hypothetical protein
MARFMESHLIVNEHTDAADLGRLCLQWVESGHWSYFANTG